MSTHWGLHCFTCGLDSPCWYNHGEDAIGETVKLWPQIEALLESDAAWVVFHIEPISYGVEDSIFTWLGVHAKHSLCLVSEYGALEPLRLPPVGARKG